MNIFSVVTLFILFVHTVSSKSFTVDYQNNCFLKDGKPFRYVSGSVHYYRVPPDAWSDRIYKMKMAGLNVIQTYIEWSHHEPEPGVYNFEGFYNITKFLKTVQELDMVVILRAGPFINSEREMGGLPYWLLRVNPKMKMRAYDPDYIKYMTQWYSVLLPIIEPYLYNNGGPVIMIQLENEYGDSGICDAQYKSYLRDLFNRYLKNNVVFFTVDQHYSKPVVCGKIDEVLSTIDYGPGTNVTSSFETLRWNQAKGPLVCSEFWPGWFDNWAKPHANVKTDGVVKTLVDTLNANASINMYMFHGGTSFGFGCAGIHTTSYDFDAPLNEAGDPTPKYYAIREAVGKFLPLPPGPVPKPALKMKTDPITFTKSISLWDYLKDKNHSIFSTTPLSFEQLSHPYGFVLYETTIPFVATDPSILHIDNIGDRAHVFVNKVFQGIMSRQPGVYSIPIRVFKGQRIQILVENQGRGCCYDFKGIFKSVTLGSKTLLNWTMTPIPLDTMSLKNINWDRAEHKVNSGENITPTIYSGLFTLKTGAILDTFLKLDGWHKGVAFLNGFNLGRYWPIVGPQITLYAPSSMFKASPAVNNLILFELEHAPCQNSDYCRAQFVDTHILNGTTPEN